MCGQMCGQQVDWTLFISGHLTHHLAILFSRSPNTRVRPPVVQSDSSYEKWVLAAKPAPPHLRLGVTRAGFRDIVKRVGFPYQWAAKVDMQNGSGSVSELQHRDSIRHEKVSSRARVHAHVRVHTCMVGACVRRHAWQAARQSVWVGACRQQMMQASGHAQLPGAAPPRSA